MRRSSTVLDRKYIFEYDLGEWTYGTIAVNKDKETHALKICRTVPKAHLRNHTSVTAKLRTLMELQHPSICSISDVLEDPQNVYIISDHCAGGDIDDWMERLDDGNWLAEKTCAEYIRQALLALTHSHAVQLYHRDLRPSSFLLTSKLPDATVKVVDIGLSALLAPDNYHAMKHNKDYAAPELLSGQAGFSPEEGAAADMYSIGAITHTLLVGHPPGRQSSGQSTGWNFATRLAGSITGSDEEAWNERSRESRDFVRKLLHPTHPFERPTAAKALQHPWLKSLVCPHALQANKAEEREVRHKTLCYSLAVLLMPLLVPFNDFLQLRDAFLAKDTNNDGLLHWPAAIRLLLARCNLDEAVTNALNIVDISKGKVIDLCSAACADVIAREFFAAGPTSAPLAGPFTATDLAPRMLKRFFEVFGDQKDPMVQVGTVRMRLRTATARDVEQYAAVHYETILSCLPEGSVVDGQELAARLSENGGRGTPLALCEDEDVSPNNRDSLWNGGFGLDVVNIFQSCGGGHKRDDSPHGMRF